MHLCVFFVPFLTYKLYSSLFFVTLLERCASIYYSIECLCVAIYAIYWCCLSITRALSCCDSFIWLMHTHTPFMWVLCMCGMNDTNWIRNDVTREKRKDSKWHTQHTNWLFSVEIRVRNSISTPYPHWLAKPVQLKWIMKSKYKGKNLIVLSESTYITTYTHI